MRQGLIVAEGIRLVDSALKNEKPLPGKVAHLVESVTNRPRPRVDDIEGRKALAVAIDILEKIKAPAAVIASSLADSN